MNPSVRRASATATYPARSLVCRGWAACIRKNQQCSTWAAFSTIGVGAAVGMDSAGRRASARHRPPEDRDAIIHATLRDANISLVSVTENIDETPSGMLMHGILASMAEFYSLNLAQEVLKA